MEALTSFFSATATATATAKSSIKFKNSSSSPSLSASAALSPKKVPSRCRPLLFRSPLIASSKGTDGDFDLPSDDNDFTLSVSPLSKDAAMGLVLSAATGKGWTTGSGMEGPPHSAGDAESTAANISTFPWSLFTKSPRRRMLIAFTCNICTQRTTRAINPHAYTDGTVFVQCCGCNAYHKLVDNLNLFDGMKCYINSSFKHGDSGADVNFEYGDIDDSDDGGFFGV